MHEALERFDGTHTVGLVEALDVAHANVDALVGLCGERDVAVAATWVVKALVEQGVAVDLADVFGTLDQQADWAAQLHILQCVQYGPDAAVAHVEAIRDLLDAKKALVRVGAPDAFVHVAEIDAGLRKEATGLVAAALDADAASLRARARALKVICATW